MHSRALRQLSRMQWKSIRCACSIIFRLCRFAACRKQFPLFSKLRNKCCCVCPKLHSRLLHCAPSRSNVQCSCLPDTERNFPSLTVPPQQHRSGCGPDPSGTCGQPAAHMAPLSPPVQPHQIISASISHPRLIRSCLDLANPTCQKICGSLQLQLQLQIPIGRKSV